MKLTAKLWIGIGVLSLISPVGLILPAHFSAGSAWGEWGSGEMTKLVGYVPEGLCSLSGLWKAPVPDYAIKGWENKGMGRLSISYIVSALAGIALITVVTMLIGKLLVKKGSNDE